MVDHHHPWTSIRVYFCYIPTHQVSPQRQQTGDIPLLPFFHPLLTCRNHSLGLPLLALPSPLGARRNN